MHLVRQREGQRIQVLGDRVTIKMASPCSPFGQAIVSVEVPPGDMVHLPPFTPHGYRNSSDKPARFLACTIGGPMDRFFETMADFGVEPVEAPR